MATMDVNDSSHLSADSSQVGWLGLRVGSQCHLALSVHHQINKMNSRNGLAIIIRPRRITTYRGCLLLQAE